MQFLQVYLFAQHDDKKISQSNNQGRLGYLEQAADYFSTYWVSAPALHVQLRIIKLQLQLVQPLLQQTEAAVSTHHCCRAHTCKHKITEHQLQQSAALTWLHKVAGQLQPVCINLPVRDVLGMPCQR